MCPSFDPSIFSTSNEAPIRTSPMLSMALELVAE